MPRKRNKSQSAASNHRGNDPETTVLERVQDLTWALLDEEINDDEMSLLDTLLISDDLACRRYIECVQLHVDLMAHYAAEPTAAAAEGTKMPPILSFLNVATPLGFESQAEDATQ